MKNSDLKLNKQRSFSFVDEDSELSVSSQSVEQLAINKRRSSRTVKKEKTTKEKGVINIVTILFMSHRI